MHFGETTLIRKALTGGPTREILWFQLCYPKEMSAHLIPIFRDAYPTSLR